MRDQIFALVIRIAWIIWCFCCWCVDFSVSCWRYLVELVVVHVVGSTCRVCLSRCSCHNSVFQVNQVATKIARSFTLVQHVMWICFACERKIFFLYDLKDKQTERKSFTIASRSKYRTMSKLVFTQILKN
jgi:hypothetical protein